MSDMNRDPRAAESPIPGTIAWHVEYLPVVDSTNRRAIERAMEHWSQGRSAEGLAVIAGQQTAGRGQHSRTWESPRGGLYLSAVVEDVPPALRDRLALLAGVALVESLGSPETYEDPPPARRRKPRVELGIRWPNDVMAGDRKLAGILCEAVSQADRWAGVIGIGVNVETDLAELPSHLRRHTSTLQMLDGRRRSMGGLARAVLGNLGAWMELARREGLSRLVEQVRRLDLLRGRMIRFDDGTSRFSALAEGIDDEGRLILRPEGRQSQAYSRGSIVRP